MINLFIIKISIIRSHNQVIIKFKSISFIIILLHIQFFVKIVDVTINNLFEYHEYLYKPSFKINVLQFFNFTLFKKMWNQFLNQSRSQRKFDNSVVIILGNKHSGKRSLIQSLFQLSKTTFHNKRLATQTDLTTKIRLKGVTTAIDYAYLNVLDISDPDYRTHSKLEVYLVEDSDEPQIFKELSNPTLLKKALIVLMLDFTNPWTFMSQLDKWVRFIYELQKNSGFKITELQQMKKKVQDYYCNFKEPQFDQFGKLKIDFSKAKQQQSIGIPLPEGALTSNLRLPLVVCVNKCDLQSSVLRDDSANKIAFILYHLRKFCLQYGGALVYTSVRNNVNLNVLYQYILHRSYGQPLRFKPEVINEETIFVPLGFDNPNFLKDSVLNLDVQRAYEDYITAPSEKKNLKEEIIVEQDSKYFEKYISTATSSVITGVSSSSSSTIEAGEGSRNLRQSEPSSQQSQVKNFFFKLLDKQGPSASAAQKQKREEASKLLKQKILEGQNKKQDKQ